MANEDSFPQIVERCDELRNRFSGRKEMNDKCTAVYLMDDPDDMPTGDDVKKTLSPDGHNAVEGAVRLMTSTSPKFKIPREKNSDKSNDKSDVAEKFANALWYANGRIRQKPLENDIVHSAVLWAEFACGIDSTKDLLEWAKGGSKAAIMRAERNAEKTPIKFQGPWDINTCYPEYADGELVFFHRKTKVKSGVILDAFGKLALAAGLTEGVRDEDLEYCESVDDVYRAMWIDGKDIPLIFDEHKLPRMNVVCQIVSGASVHEKEEDKRHPFLKAAIKSGLLDRHTLALTNEYTNIFRHATNPQNVYKTNNTDKPEIYIDKAVSGTVVIGTNEAFGPLEQEVIDPQMLELTNLAERKIEQSTIYSQSLGGNIAGSNTAYSTIALLNQSGRLPLVDIQKGCAFGMGQMMEIAFDMIKDGKAQAKVNGDSGLIELKPTDIQKYTLFDVKLDVDLPQDQRQNAQVAVQLVNAGISSREFARGIVGIEQSSEEQKKIYKEKAEEVILQTELQKQVQEIQMQAQSEMQQSQQQVQPQQQPQQMPQAQTPEMQGQSAQAGLPMTAPMDLQQGGSEMPPEQEMPV
jgi:hypothetical protein